MQTGTKISAIAHGLVIGWAVFGGVFRSEPLPFEVQQVAIVSAEEFAAMTAPRQAPEVTAVPEGLSEPEVAPDSIALPEPEPAPEVAPPAPVASPETAPEPPPEPVTDVPEPDIPPDSPSLEQVDPEVEIVAAPPGQRPKPRPVDRVAPVPVAAPPPEARPDEVESPEIAEEDGAETRQDPSEATAPEAATDQIVTEATETDETAPLRSPRPPARRPSAPRSEDSRPRQAEQAPEPDPGPTESSAVEDALRQALGGQSEAPAPSGPPLTGGEKDAFRIAVQNCWNVDVGSQAANVTVVVGMQMDKSGKVVSGSLRMLSATGGEGRAVQTAFQAARRAVIRCQKDGYDLPADKYDYWRDIEITFDPGRMRNR